jgi:hypothetical protein
MAEGEREMKDKDAKFSEDDLNACWPKYQIAYFVDVLNGDYDLDEARSDLHGLIGSKFDLRKKEML